MVIKKILLMSVLWDIQYNIESSHTVFVKGLKKPHHETDRMTSEAYRI